MVENIQTCVVPSEDAFLSAEDLISHSSDIMLKNKIPHTFPIKTEIPLNGPLKWDIYSTNSTISFPASSNILEGTKSTTTDEYLPQKCYKKVENENLPQKKSSTVSKNQNIQGTSLTKTDGHSTSSDGEKMLSYEELSRRIQENNESRLNNLTEKLQMEKNLYKKKKHEIKKHQLKLIELRKQVAARMVEVGRLRVLTYEPSSPSAVMYSMEDVFGTGKEGYNRAVSFLKSLKSAKERGDQQKIREIIKELLKTTSTAGSTLVDRNQPKSTKSFFGALEGVNKM